MANPGRRQPARTRSPWRLWLGCVLLIGLSVLGRGAEGDAGLDLSSLGLDVWQTSVEGRLGVGYRDNVLLSGFHPQESGFEQTALDLMVFRLPYDGTEFHGLFSLEDRRYFSVPDAEKEQTVLISTMLRRGLGSRWTAAMNGQYFYMDQVFDASITEYDVGVVTARGHHFSVRPVVEYDVGRQFRMAAEIPVGRQFLSQPLDSYWEGGVGFSVRRELGRRSQVQVGYRAQRRDYDTRAEASTDGTLIPDSGLAYRIQRVECDWRQEWDPARAWATRTRVGWEVTQDDGSGYFDYDRAYAVQQIEWKPRGWSCRLEGGVNHYEYRLQQASDTDSSRRAKDLVTLGVRATRRFGSRVQVFVAYEREESMSNQPGDEYEQNTVSAGMGVEF